ncbi:MAG TPA: ABC transporter ATP-binding protein [Candidatus Binatia bacterium]|jgi:iron(III) transport system ATP-binding protein
MPIVSARHLKKVFQQTLAVDDVSFDVEPGEFVTLLGPSGCGKTTTLRLIAGLEECDFGEIHLNNRLVNSPAAKVYVPPEKRAIGMVFQSYAIWPHMNVFENVAFPLRLRHVPKATIKEKVNDILKLFDLHELGPRLATKLSGGQQQRVAIARALAVEPSVLLMDEPLSNLDAKLRERMRVELRSLQRRTGISTLYVTHDQAEAMILSDRIIVMNKGKIEQIGSPEEIYQKPLTRFVTDFVGGSNIIQLEVTATEGPLLRANSVQSHQQLLCESSPGAVDMQRSRMALVRPENIRLSTQKSAPEDMNIWPGRVESMLYVGDSREYDVKVGELLLHARTPPDVVFQKGDSVAVHFAPKDVILIET